MAFCNKKRFGSFFLVVGGAIVGLSGLSSFCDAADNTAFVLDQGQEQIALVDDTQRLQEESLAQLQQIVEREISSEENEESNVVEVRKDYYVSGAAQLTPKPAASTDSEVKAYALQQVAMAREISRLKGELQRTNERLEAAVAERERVFNRLPEISEKIEQLKTKLAQREQEIARLQDNAQAKGGELSARDQEVRQKEEALRSCNDQLASAKQVNQAFPEVRKELIAAKNELLLKETELKVLRQGTGTMAGVGSTTKTPAAAENLKSSRGASAVAPAAAKASDVAMVRVKDAKVNLRTGPGEEHSPLMQVPKGSRLLVEAREGDWYRVMSPTGTRAYVKADVVEIDTGAAGESPLSSPPVVVPVPEVKADLSPQRARLSGESKSQVGPAQPVRVFASESERGAANDQELVPFGTVNLSAKSKLPERVLSGSDQDKKERAALDVLRGGLGGTPGRSMPPEVISQDEAEVIEGIEKK